MNTTTAPSLAQLINRASRALARDGDAALKPLGLRYAQVPVLALLSGGRELTQKALAEAAGIEQPSMAQLLTRMDPPHTAPARRTQPHDRAGRRDRRTRDRSTPTLDRPRRASRRGIHRRGNRHPQGLADPTQQQPREDEWPAVTTTAGHPSSLGDGEVREADQHETRSCRMTGDQTPTAVDLHG